MPDMFVFAGCNGAGKSTLVDELQIEYDELINPDNYAQEINPLEPRKADLSAGKLAIAAIKRCLEERKSFAVETTLSGKYILHGLTGKEGAHRCSRHLPFFFSTRILCFPLLFT
jgi:predicted ABC-type ATPase